ncbi:MAG: hypothetical protein LBD12_07985 [Clostridiales Family XIII bacterium]|jgi:hypothetical protein|nr:hypothetical protein [Clostridiales Family XIII bacterium]
MTLAAACSSPAAEDPPADEPAVEVPPEEEGDAGAKQYTPAEGFDPADGIYVKAQTDLYWEARYSDGRGYAEYLAKTLTGDYANIENFAVGGAFSGILTGSKEAGDERSNWSPWLKGWGGVEQTETFLSENGGKAPADGLYVISTGGNDSYAAADIGEEAAVEKSVECIVQMVDNLAKAGATDILVMMQSTHPGEAEESSFTKLHREKEKAAIESYAVKNAGLNLVLLDPQPLWEDMKAQGMEPYGYKTWGFYLISDWVPAYGYAYVKDDNSDKLPTSEAEDIYEYGYYYSTDSKYYAPDTADYAVDEFLTYDEYHLSSRSQKHVATYVLGADVDADDGAFAKVYAGEDSAFAKSKLAKKQYAKIYTFGDSGIDTGRANEITKALVDAR